MRDPNDKGEFSPELNAMLEDAVRQSSRPLTSHELRKQPMPDTRTRQQRRQEERKGVRKPDIDSVAQMRAEARRIDDRKRQGVTAASIDRFNPQVWGGKLNIYTCDECHAHIVTRDVDEGVSPFMLSSKNHCPNKCGEGIDGINRVMMTSSMYRVYDQSMREDYQWYAPDARERSQASAYQRDHYNKGGLEIRKAVFGD